MTDRFDDLLSAALTPPHREPDRAFVARIQRQVLVEQRLAAEQAAIFARLATELIAVLAVAGGLMLIARAPAIAEIAGRSPGATLAALIGGFALLLAVMRSGERRGFA